MPSLVVKAHTPDVRAMRILICVVNLNYAATTVAMEVTTEVQAMQPVRDVGRAAGADLQAQVS
jgi:hypothetical protein